MCTRSPKYLMLNTAFVFNVHCILSIFPQLIGILNFIHSVFSHPVFSQSPNLDSVQIYFSALCLPVNQTITSHIQRGHLVPSLLLRHVCYYFEVTRFQQAPSLQRACIFLRFGPSCYSNQGLDLRHSALIKSHKLTNYLDNTRFFLVNWNLWIPSIHEYDLPFSCSTQMVHLQLDAAYFVSVPGDLLIITYTVTTRAHVALHIWRPKGLLLAAVTSANPTDP